MEPGPAPRRGGAAPVVPPLVSGGTSSVCSALAPLRSGRPAAGLARRPGLRSGLAPGLGPCGPLGRAGPGSGPLRSLWVAAGVASACRRAACARRRGPGAPPAAPAAAWAGPGVGGLASPPPRPPAWGSCGPPCAPLRARCGGARPWAAPGGPSPRPRRAGAPSPGPCRAARLSPWAAAPSSLRGALGAACGRPLPRRAPLRWGIRPRSGGQGSSQAARGRP